MLKKRLFSLLLVISMLLTWIPAAGAVTFDPLGEGPVRYLVDGVPRLSTLQTAWNAAVAANNSATVTLRQDLTGTNGSLGTGAGFRGGALLVPRGKKVTLDLAGHYLDRKLTAASADGSAIIVEGELILKDSNDRARGAVMGGNSTTAGGGITVASGGVLKMQGGNVTGNTSQLTGAGGIDNRGTVEMSGGKVTSNKGGGLRQGGTLKLSGAANIAGNSDTANLYLLPNKTASVSGTLTKSARVGVTTEQLPAPAGSLPAVTGSVTEAYLDKIVADQSTLYKTAFEDGKIVVRNLVDHAPVSVNPQAQSANTTQQTAAATAPVQRAKARSSTPEVPVQVSFYLNYVSSGGAPSTITVAAGKPYGNPTSGLFPADPTRDGYVFDGWYTSANNGQGVKITRDTIVSNTNAHSLYAHWKAGQVSVFFDAQGGTVSPTSMLVSIGEPYGALPVPTLSGRRFLGWYTAPDGGQEVTAASTVKQQYEHTLYAMWGAEAKPWLVSFHNLDDSGNDAVFIDATGADGKMTLPTPAACGFSAPEGKSFAGWSSSWNGLDITPAGAVMTFTQNSDLYAVWQSGQQDTQDPSESPAGAEYTVTYLLDGTIEGETVTESREENKAFPLMDNPTVKTGYHFVGWSNEGKIYKVNESFQMPSHDVTFTAVWEAGEVDTVTVSFDANYEGAPAVNPASKEVTVGQKYGELPSPARNGYSFDGWYTEPASDRGVLVTADDTVRFTSDHVLYAHWTNTVETKKYKITLKGNGGTVNGKDEDVFYRDEGEAYSDGLVVPKRSGYGFVGWFDGDDIVGASTPATKDTILDAVWKPLGEGDEEESGEGFLITFDANDDSGRQFTRRTEPDGWMDLPACEFAPIESNIVFDVWTLDPQNEYRMSNRFHFKNDAIIYARWKHPGDTVADAPATQSTKNLEEKQEAAEQVVESKVSQSTKMKAMNSAAKQLRETTTVEITLHPGNGGGSDKKVNVDLDENGKLPSAPDHTDFTAPNGHADDYEFKGWAENSTDTEPIETYPYEFKRDPKELYAIWGEKTSTPSTEKFTITFDPTDGKGSMESITADKNAEYTLPDNGFTKPQNKVFAGWAVGAANASEVKQPGETIIITANVDLYATWETGYTVNFDANYPDAPAIASVEYAENETYASKWGTAPTRTGYTFDSWYTTTAATADSKIVGTELVTGDITLYANWTPNSTPDTYEVTFDLNYTDAPAASKRTYTAGETYASKWGPDPTRTDYRFEGWFDASGDTGNKVDGDTAVGEDTPKTLYAHWVEQVTITFDANNGSGTMDAVSIDKNTEYTLPGNGFTAPTTPSGMVFGGWTVGDDTTIRQSDYKLNVTADITVKAVWGKSVTITYDGNGAIEGSTEKGHAVAGVPFALPDCGFTAPSGMQFAGWAVGEKTTTRPLQPGAMHTYQDDTTVYAIWDTEEPEQPTKVTVTFDLNHDTDAEPAKLTMDVGSKYMDNPNFPADPTWTGFTFTGWSLEPTTVGTETTTLIDAATTVKNSDHSLYAVWKADADITVTFQSGAGTGSDYVWTTDQAGNFILPEPGDLKMEAPAGKQFIAWEITTASRATERKKAGETFTLTSDTTITAIWGGVYKITYALPWGYGSGTMPDDTAYENTPFTLPECKFNPPSGYRFNGWSIGDVHAAQVREGSTYTFTADTTVFATWIMTGSGGSSGSGSSGGGASHPIWDGNSKPGSSSGSGSIGGSDSEQAVAQVILNASAGTGGTISPSGQVRVERGRDQEFTITPNAGYVISDVLVDNSSVGAVSRYTFNSVQRAHSIQATFAPSAAAQTETPADTAATAGTADYLSCAQGSDCPIMFYSDIVSNGWYHDGVHYCLDSGLMSGTTTSSFEPTAKLTRAMLAQIIYNQAGRPSVSGGNSFSDVVGGAWYENAVNYAVSTGLMAGYENGSFGPNDPITREQLVVVLWRHAGSPASGVSVPLSDFFDTRAYADEAMRWAYGRGIISGKSNGLLDPSGQATRVEVAQMLKSYFA